MGTLTNVSSSAQRHYHTNHSGLLLLISKNAHMSSDKFCFHSLPISTVLRLTLLFIWELLTGMSKMSHLKSGINKPTLTSVHNREVCIRVIFILRTTLKARIIGKILACTLGSRALARICVVKGWWEGEHLMLFSNVGQGIQI